VSVSSTGATQKLLGNYGVLYRFALGLPAPATAAVAPRGGGWGGVLRAGSSAAVALPSATQQLATTTDAIVVGAASGELRLMTGGGSNLPIDVFLVTP
jgi:hypothetical protein